MGTAPVPQPPLLSALTVLLRGRRVLVVGALSGLVLAMILMLTLKPYYVATVRFLPPQNSQNSTSNILAQLGGLGALAGLSGGGKSSGDLYVGLITTEGVEDPLVQKFDLMSVYHQKLLSRTRRDLEEHTAVDAKGKDGIIRLAVTDESPNRAAELANAYVSQLQAVTGTLAVTEASQRRLFLERQLDASKEKLAAAEDALKLTEQRTGVIQVEAQARALIETAAQLNAQIAAKEVQIESMRTYAGAGNVELMQAEQELAGMRAQLARMNAQQGGEDSLTPEKGQLTASGLEYLRKTRDVRYQETLFEILARQYEAAKLDEAKEGSLIQVVDAAAVPDYKAGPKRLVILLGCTLLGIVLAVFWIFARAFAHSSSTFTQAVAMVRSVVRNNA